MQHVLFICSQNQLRSPTAEHLFSKRPGFEVRSAGTNPDAVIPISSDLVEWADTIFVMERVHRNRLTSRFQSYLAGKQLICLDIPDEFEFMQPELVRLLEAKVGSFFQMGTAS
jgi:predicted protein tyrosine phosphatase